MRKPPQDLTGVETIYEVMVLRIRRTYATGPDVELWTARKPFDVNEVLKTIFATLDDNQEHMILLILNLAQEIKGYKVIASGGQEHTYVDAKILFRNALLLGASGIILAHNHPSNDPEPSAYDVELTQTLVQGGKLLNLDVLDHIVYTTRGYTSIRHTNPEIFEDEEDEQKGKEE
jgi:DNA repair protein RadC